MEENKLATRGISHISLSARPDGIRDKRARTHVDFSCPSQTDKCAHLDCFFSDGPDESAMCVG